MASVGYKRQFNLTCIHRISLDINTRPQLHLGLVLYQGYPTTYASSKVLQDKRAQPCVKIQYTLQASWLALRKCMYI